MALDPEAERIVLETLGPNVYRQLTMVVPDFYDNNGMAVKCMPIPEERRKYVELQLLN